MATPQRAPAGSYIGPSDRQRLGMPLRDDEDGLVIDPVAMLKELAEMQTRLERLGAGPERDRIVAKMRGMIAAFDEWRQGPTTEEKEQMDSIRTRADATARAWGETASPPLPGERLKQYRLRLLRKYQAHSPAYSLTRFDSTTPADLLAAATEQIFADAKEAGRVARVDFGEMTTFTDIDPTGRKVVTATGDNFSWMAPFMLGGQRVKLIEPEEFK